MGSRTDIRRRRPPTIAVSHVQEPKLSIPVSQFLRPVANQPTKSGVSESKSEQKSLTKLYGIGRDNYLMIDNGVPYLMKKEGRRKLELIPNEPRDVEVPAYGERILEVKRKVPEQNGDSVQLYVAYYKGVKDTLYKLRSVSGYS